MTPADRAREIARCLEEIARAWAEIPYDIGALIGWADWCLELRILEAAQASGEGK